MFPVLAVLQAMVPYLILKRTGGSHRVNAADSIKAQIWSSAQWIRWVLVALHMLKGSNFRDSKATTRSESPVPCIKTAPMAKSEASVFTT